MIETIKQALDWFRCFRDKSMSRNNAEELAAEIEESLRQAIEQAEEKNCKNCVIDKPCIAKGKDMQICGAFVSKHAKELKQIALEKKAENARELGLDYEPVPWIESMTIDSTNELSKPTAPVQEPVAWMYPDDLERFETSETFAQAYSIEMVSPTQGETVPLYTTPQPQREFVGLTDDERNTIARHHAYVDNIIKAVEAKLKQKNGG